MMPKYKIFRDETYVFYLEADSREAAREMADDQVCDERELVSVHYEVIEEIPDEWDSWRGVGLHGYADTSRDTPRDLV